MLAPCVAVIALAQHMLREGKLELPPPGGGSTAQRFDALAEIAAHDLSLVRLCEGHTDAVAILAEAGASARPGLYGVWAADGDRVTARRGARGWILAGRKRYASGAAGLQRALITAGTQLFDVDLGSPGVRPIAGTWNAVGMADTESVDIELRDVEVGEPIGAAGFYLSRRGFWSGAVGVAACWYGGALGCLRMVRTRLVQPDAHQRAHLGAIAATCDLMKVMLHAAAAEIDAGTADRRRALIVRHVVEQGCQDVLARTGRAGGTGPLVFDREHARRCADLVVYLRQHHAERDLAELGTLELS